MDFGAVFSATAIVASLTTLGMGLLSNYPFVVAPSLSLAAFFSYGAVGNAGLSWQTVLGACFCAGIILLILSVFKWREKILHAIPAPLRYATTGGIGLFFAIIGMKSVGLLSTHETTFIGLGTFSRMDIYLTALGILVTAALLSRRVTGAYLIGLLIIWLFGLFLGLASWNGLYALPAPLFPTLLKLDIIGSLSLKCLPIILSFVLITLFDTAASLLGLSEQARFLEGKSKLLKPDGGLYAVPLGTAAGACLGASPVTPAPEAAAGISSGGRSGLTSVCIALLFLLALFLAPLAAGMPAFTTAPILIIMGAGLLQQLKKVNWHEATDAIPALAIFLIIPLTSNIATGLTWGFLIYPLIKLISGRVKEVSWLVWVLAFLFGTSFFLV